jgi:hypothetical protein
MSFLTRVYVSAKKLIQERMLGYMARTESIKKTLSEKGIASASSITSTSCISPGGSSSSSHSHEVCDIGYRGIIQLLESYSPPLSCRAHVETDLPQLISANIPFILSECAEISTSRLRHLRPGDIRLSQDEALAVCLYTYDLGMNSTMDNGQDNLYVQMNNLLRERNTGKIQILKPFIAYLMRGLTKLPVFRGVVYRGIPQSQLDLVRSSYRGGVDVHWSAFTSTTLSLPAAKTFAKGHGGIIFRIRTLSGRRISCYSQFQNEEEIVISPNAQFVVTSECNLNNEDGYHYVDLMEKRQEKVVF